MAERSYIKWRIILNFFAMLTCASGAMVFYFLKNSIETDSFIQEEMFGFAPYLFLGAAILLLVMAMFFIFIAFDASIYFNWVIIDDLKDCYVFEIARMLGYKIKREKRVAELGLEPKHEATKN
jgi:hypothetical protein